MRVSFCAMKRSSSASSSELIQRAARYCEGAIRAATPYSAAGAVQPAGNNVRGRGSRGHAVLGRQPMRDDFELQHADRTEQHLPVVEAENLDRAFVSELCERGA